MILHPPSFLCASSLFSLLSSFFLFLVLFLFPYLFLLLVLLLLLVVAAAATIVVVVCFCLFCFLPFWRFCLRMAVPTVPWRGLISSRARSHFFELALSCLCCALHWTQRKKGGCKSMRGGRMGASAC